MKVYLDVCAIGRLSDDRRQARIAAEAEAIERIFRMIFLHQIEWAASESLEREIRRNPDHDKRNDALTALRHAGPVVVTTEAIRRRAEVLHQLGYGAFDALHLAHAEEAKVDALITTDDRFIARASRGAADPCVRL